MLTKNNHPIYCIIIIIGSFIFGCNVPQKSHAVSSKKKPSEKIIDGKCFSKSLMQSTYRTNNLQYAVYTGSNTPEQDDNLEINEIVLQPAFTKWEKKKGDRNCLSPDPNDCLVWCLVQTPAAIDTLVIVKDTSINKDYEIRNIE